MQVLRAFDGRQYFGLFVFGQLHRFIGLGMIWLLMFVRYRNVHGVCTKWGKGGRLISSVWDMGRENCLEPASRDSF